MGRHSRCGRPSGKGGPWCRTWLSDSGCRTRAMPPSNLPDGVHCRDTQGKRRMPLGFGVFTRGRCPLPVPPQPRGRSSPPLALPIKSCCVIRARSPEAHGLGVRLQRLSRPTGRAARLSCAPGRPRLVRDTCHVTAVPSTKLHPRPCRHVVRNMAPRLRAPADGDVWSAQPSADRALPQSREAKRRS